MLDPKEELKFKNFKKQSAELGIPCIIPEVFIGLKVHDKNGLLVFDDLQRGHSWTRNYYNLVFADISSSAGGNSNNFGAGYMSSKSTNGTVRYSSTYGAKAADGFISPISTTTYGIVVGTSATAFSLADYALAALVASGTGSGQLSYQAMTRPVPTYGSTSWTTTLSRIMNNNSGADITIRETGLQWNGSGFESASTNAYLVERSVLAPSVTVINGGQLTVTYEITMDFSAIDS